MVYSNDLGPIREHPLKRLLLLIVLMPSIVMGDMNITFIDAGQADAAVIQIDQDSGEPFTIIVDGGDGDRDLEDNIPGLMTGDPTVELLIVSHPHRDHTGALDWLINDSGKTIGRIWWGGDDHDIDEFKAFKAAVDAKDLILTRPSETTFSFFAATDFSIRCIILRQRHADLPKLGIEAGDICSPKTYRINLCEHELFVQYGPD